MSKPLTIALVITSISSETKNQATPRVRIASGSVMKRSSGLTTVLSTPNTAAANNRLPASSTVTLESTSAFVSHEMTSRSHSDGSRTSPLDRRGRRGRALARSLVGGALLQPRHVLVEGRHEYLGKARARREAERGADEHVGDREPVGHEVLAAVALERFGHCAGGGRKALARLLGPLGLGFGEDRRLDQRRLELGGREGRPLIDERAFVRPERRRQAQGGVKVGEMQADRRRLEHISLVVLKHGHADEWM